MKTKMNLLKKFNKGDLPFFFFWFAFVVVVDMGVGNTIIEYLDRVVKIYMTSPVSLTPSIPRPVCPCLASAPASYWDSCYNLCLHTYL